MSQNSNMKLKEAALRYEGHYMPSMRRGCNYFHYLTDLLVNAHAERQIEIEEIDLIAIMAAYLAKNRRTACKREN